MKSLLKVQLSLFSNLEHFDSSKENIDKIYKYLPEVEGDNNIIPNTFIMREVNMETGNTKDLKRMSFSTVKSDEKNYAFNLSIFPEKMDISFDFVDYRIASDFNNISKYINLCLQYISPIIRGEEIVSSNASVFLQILNDCDSSNISEIITEIGLPNKWYSDKEITEFNCFYNTTHKFEEIDINVINNVQRVRNIENNELQDLLTTIDIRTAFDVSNPKIDETYLVKYVPIVLKFLKNEFLRESVL